MFPFFLVLKRLTPESLLSELRFIQNTAPSSFNTVRSSPLRLRLETLVVTRVLVLLAALLGTLQTSPLTVRITTKELLMATSRMEDLMKEQERDLVTKVTRLDRGVMCTESLTSLKN